MAPSRARHGYPPDQATAGTPPGAASEARLRMRDLVRESGLPRETIHFYRLQGLLPEPVKTGRNTALYTFAHLERLRRIRELQEQQFLPLKAIRAILDDTAAEGFTPEQEDLVRRVRATLVGWTGAQQRPTVPVADFVPDRVSRHELRELVGAGLIAVDGKTGGGTVTEDDAVILECWAQFKEAGLGPRQGFAAAQLRVYDDAMERLVTREARLALDAYADAPAEELSRVVELVAPVIGRLLSAMHRKRLRRFLLDVGHAGEPAAPVPRRTARRRTSHRAR
jgi:DNA-binding transcriptional MerR regulator